MAAVFNEDKIMKSIFRFAAIVLVVLAAFGAFLCQQTHGADSEGERPLIQQLADGRIELNARDVTIHGTTVRYEPQPQKNTIGYWTRASDWVSWTFQLKQPGRYQVDILQACGKGSGGSEFILAVDNQQFTNTVVDTGAFTNFVTRTIGVAELPKAGTINLSVKPVKKPGQAVMDLRLVTLRPVP